MPKHLIMTPKILEMLRSRDKETQTLGLVLMGYDPITRQCYEVLDRFLSQYKIITTFSSDKTTKIVPPEDINIYLLHCKDEKEETKQTTKTSV